MLVYEVTTHIYLNIVNVWYSNPFCTFYWQYLYIIGLQGKYLWDKELLLCERKCWSVSSQWIKIFTLDFVDPLRFNTRGKKHSKLLAIYIFPLHSMSVVFLYFSHITADISILLPSSHTDPLLPITLLGETSSQLPARLSEQQGSLIWESEGGKKGSERLELNFSWKLRRARVATTYGAEEASKSLQTPN